MLNNLLEVHLPMIDTFFAAWNIPPSMSKIVLLFAGAGAFLLSRVTDAVLLVAFPICMTFLVAATVIVNYYLQDAMGPGFTPVFKLIASAGLGQTIAACFLMAFFKTGEIKRVI